jgi:hypothetical protein
MAEKDARLQARAEAYGETNLRATEEERAARVEAEAEERLDKVNVEVDQRRRAVPGDPPAKADRPARSA